ncbi:GlxA family transcriptional regulator [Cryptosporangium aurantiacum]|uniref:Transcriptional regulator GlxA family, contains an amidase domain and an AraC-type DNA-binding HTH domain n=1 Tax=Cryptosporangium aurantiacum TaxID=134849 RepID=A0A1M7HUP7_9ACTN|nr:helix-turn-helix domain-containing protein [Cryptosporangium aurantiacum]SHM32195.1 Transcriptional regulator GlxA family, contains an amidase domain and an AraC-type DNA-binding HTH domain [Cryptosporangium aurantiacum]
MDARHRVAVLLLDDAVPFDAGIPGQVFGSADRGGKGLYRVHVCSPGAAPVQTTAGYAILPKYGLEELETADTVLIPGIRGKTAGTRDFPTEALDAVRAAAARGARTASICTGAFVLAATGLLDGRRATTHWLWADAFRARYPQVTLDPDVLFIDDGPIASSAGVAAGIDLCLHLVRRDHGSEVANHAARRCVAPPWREGGQAQYVERPMPATSDASTGSTRAWALEHLNESLDLATLAAHAGMSVRTFTRRFRQETGQAPGTWLTAHRVDRARHLLEETDLSVERIAHRAGFGTTASLRQHFAASVGTSPGAYRRTFRAAPGNGTA